MEAEAHLPGNKGAVEVGPPRAIEVVTELLAMRVGEPARGERAQAGEFFDGEAQGAATLLKDARSPRLLALVRGQDIGNTLRTPHR